MVPTMSCPMFMPERKSARKPNCGLAAWTSSSAEEMLMATSITAPRALTMMPATSSPCSPMGVPVCRSWSRGSTSATRSPLTRQRDWASSPKSMAKAVPATVPSMAHSVFRFMPPRIVKLTMVMYTQTRNTVGRVGAPRISRGKRI